MGQTTVAPWNEGWVGEHWSDQVAGGLIEFCLLKTHCPSSEALSHCSFASFSFSQVCRTEVRLSLPHS